jgi:hypothetical protein
LPASSSSFIVIVVVIITVRDKALRSVPSLNENCDKIFSVPVLILRIPM